MARTASTALPPPIGKPATANFRVMAADRSIASARASEGDAYTFIRVPPLAGPSALECTQTNIHVPLGASKWTTVSSPSHASMSSSNMTLPVIQVSVAGATIAPVLIDRFLPEFDVSEHHVARVHAPVDRAYAAVR